jgi:uncharacterized protein YgbK (DUF1537 family)
LENRAKFALVIADDVTGACDAGVHFAARGMHTRFCFSGNPAHNGHALRGGSATGEEATTGAASPSVQQGFSSKISNALEPRSAVSAVHGECANADVIAVSTESRSADKPEIVSGMQNLARAFSPRPQVIFKKIDSVLRGRPGVEIAAALAAFDCELALITPAFPALGRRVKEGVLQVDGSLPMNVAATLRDDGLDGCFHGSPREAMLEGWRYVSVDAQTDGDLRQVVETALALRKRLLWAGSGGLAAALSAALCGNECKVQPPARVAAPVIFCIGSTHPATLVQQEQLLRSRPAVVICADTSAHQDVATALAGGKHAIVRIVRGVTPAERIRALFQGTRPAAILCCGGDTGSLVCAAIGAAGIELRGEIVAGVPWGVLSGGMMEGAHAVTKSGGFGDPDTLIRTADWFTCPSH